MIKKVYDVLVYQQAYRKDIATRFSPRKGFENLVVLGSNFLRKYKNNIACSQQPMVAKKNFGVGGKKIWIFVQWN